MWRIGPCPGGGELKILNAESGSKLRIMAASSRDGWQRKRLPQVVRKVRRGMRFTVLYRSRPAFQVVPVDVSEAPKGGVAEDPLYRARPLGRSAAGRSAADHDALLYDRFLSPTAPASS